MKNRLLITGAAGFVGKYLIEAGRTAGYEVFGTNIALPDKTYQDFIELDVTDFDQCLAVLESIKPQKIIHLAGFSSVKASYEKPELCMHINYEGSRNLLNAVSKVDPEVSVLMIGSAEVYGTPQYLPIDEIHPIDGKNPYALSRIAQESLLKEFSNLNIVMTRSFNHTGSGQPLGFVLPDFAHQIAAISPEEKSRISVGNLDSVREFTHVRDVCRAYIMLVEKGHKGCVYNVCSGQKIKISKLLHKIIQISNKEVVVDIDPQKFRPLDVKEYYGSFSKLATDTGWRPEISIDQIIEEVYSYWLDKAN